MKKEEKAVVDAERVREAERILKEYKRGKASLEARIVDNELWYRMRHASPHAKERARQRERLAVQRAGEQTRRRHG